MRTLLTTLAVLTSLNIAFAWHEPTATLNLRSADNSVMRVFMNGTEIPTQGNVMRADNLPAGQHFLQVFVSRGWGHQPMRTVFNGSIVLRPNSEHFATVLPGYNKIRFDRIVAYAPQHNWYPQQPNNACMARPTVNPVCEPAPEQPVYGPMPINNYDFNALRQTIQTQPFESAKLTILKQAVPQHYFSTQQVTDIMQCFTFESYRLEVAKLMYPQVLDQQNYYLVNNAFSFSSSVRELGEFLAMR